MELKITDEHRWLQRLVGTWRAESGGDDGAIWNEMIEPVGEVFVQADAAGNMPDGSPWRTLLTIGFDPQRGKFVGSFAGSMMTNLWVYEGELDDSGQTLTLNTEGPEWHNGQMTRFKDIIEWEGDDRRVFRSEMQNEDGSWEEIMRTVYVRAS